MVPDLAGRPRPPHRQPRPDTQGTLRPAASSCQPLDCRNSALSTSNIAALRAELTHIAYQLQQRPALPPLLQQRLADRHGKISTFLDRHLAETVSPRVSLPSQQDVRIALAQMEADADTTVRHPSVLALATQLGLADTAFRRHVPDVVDELTATATRSRAQTSDSTSYARLKQDNATLRRDNQDLAEHLELAIAHIQRLTLEAHQLRQQLEAATKITRIGLKPPLATRPR